MKHIQAISARMLLAAILMAQTPATLAYPYDQFPSTVEYFTQPVISETQQPVQPMRMATVRQQEPTHIHIPVDFEYVTRSDFVTAVIVGFHPEGIPSQCFEQLSLSSYSLLFGDVSKAVSYGPHLCAAMTMGLVSGYADATFRPNQPVNYAEASKILTKAFGIATGSPDAEAEWYAPYVGAMQARNALPAGIALDDPVTPGMMSFMLAQLT